MTQVPLSTVAALAAAGLLGGGAALAGAAVVGALDGGGTATTTVVETERASGTPAASGRALSINDIYERSAPGVVQINTRGPSPAVDMFGQLGGPPVQALGSGFVIDRQGRILTNYHVIRGADEIDVSFSNRDRVEATVVGADPSTDLAVLKIDAGSRALTPLPLGDSDDVQVGDEVLAIGNPFGLERTATAGIVSALQRAVPAPNGFSMIDQVIQTDAPINQGNSGGPLLNLAGEVIGVNSQIESPTGGSVGIGFAVPSNTVKSVVAQLLEKGRVDRAWLGVVARPIEPELAQLFRLPVDSGLLVESVADGSAADDAGLRGGDQQVIVAGESYRLGGDLIVAAGGRRVTSVEELRAVLAERRPGDRIDLEIYRDGDKRTVTVRLGRQPTSPQG